MLVAKCKVSALWSTSKPRVEMDGAVLVTRLVYRTLESLNEEDIPERIWIVGDSETVVANWPEGRRTLGSLGSFLGIELEKLSTFKRKLRRLLQLG